MEQARKFSRLPSLRKPTSPDDFIYFHPPNSPCSRPIIPRKLHLQPELGPSPPYAHPLHFPFVPRLLPPLHSVRPRLPVGAGTSGEPAVRVGRGPGSPAQEPEGSPRREGARGVHVPPGDLLRRLTAVRHENNRNKNARLPVTATILCAGVRSWLTSSADASFKTAGAG